MLANTETRFYESEWLYARASYVPSDMIYFDLLKHVGHFALISWPGLVVYIHYFVVNILGKKCTLETALLLSIY